MKRGKYEAPRAPKRHSSKKALAMLLSLVLVIGCVAGGTLAWLQASTNPVTNTFTVGDIALTLKESPYNIGTNTYGEPAEKVNNSYPLIPGNAYKKDPTVTVTANSEDCYLFVKVKETNDPDKYLDYTLTLTTANGWKLVEGETDVYYREVKKTDAVRSWQLIANFADSTNTISVRDNVVKAGTNTEETDYVEMPAAGNEPKLTFTAYAVQQANRTVDQAWALVSGS